MKMKHIKQNRTFSPVFAHLLSAGIERGIASGLVVPKVAVLSV